MLEANLRNGIPHTKKKKRKQSINQLTTAAHYYWPDLISFKHTMCGTPQPNQLVQQLASVDEPHNLASVGLIAETSSLMQALYQLEGKVGIVACWDKTVVVN
jgi:hypothetical protein